MRYVLLLLILCVHTAHATDYRITLENKSSQSIDIGTLKVSETGNYELNINYDGFQDYFLSMKEMKCLEGPELWCHLRYPYDNPHDISNGDARWLSHDLLFMYKRPDQFGAKFWQGIYYQIETSDDGFIGHAMAIDLNELASPPDDTRKPYYDETWMEPVDVDNRWLPLLRLRPINIIEPLTMQLNTTHN